MFIFKFKNYLFNKDYLLKNNKLKIFGDKLYNPYIWYFNKYSVSRAASIGLFITWIPIPLHMIFATIFSIILKANLPISILFVWLVNPITMPVFFLFAYKVGFLFFPVYDYCYDSYDFELSFAWLFNKMYDVWKPFVSGCICCGFLCSFFMNFFIKIVWNFFVIKNWNLRKINKLR